MNGVMPPAAEQFAIEVRGLRLRLQDLPRIAGELGRYDHNELGHTLNEVQLLVDTIVRRTEVEERLLYPLTPSNMPADLTALVDDHRHLRDLGHRIAAWNPTEAREPLAQLLRQFFLVADSHLLVEGRLFAPVLRNHEQQLLGKRNHQGTPHRTAA